MSQVGHAAGPNRGAAATSSDVGSGAGFRITPRTVQIVLGVLWLLDAALQFQPYMFSPAFLNTSVGSMASGQPGPIAWAISTAAHVFMPGRVVFNALFALTQVAIGLGLLVSRRTVKPALAISFVWAFIVWWFGEGFGMLAIGMANPLTGAPGAVVLYALIGAIVWPTDRPHQGSAASAGPLGDRGGRIVWAIVWLLFAGLMLVPANHGADAFKSLFSTSAGQAQGPLVGMDNALASAFAGHGLLMAIALGVVTAAVAAGVLADVGRNLWLLLGSLLALAFWVSAEYFGGMFSGQGTDPNSGPLLVVLALTLYAPARSVAERPSRLVAGRGSRQVLIASSIVVLLAFIAGGAVLVFRQDQQSHTAPISFNQTATTANYRMLLIVAPPQPIYTPDQVRMQHPTNGEVMFSGTMAMPPGMAGMSGMSGSSYPPGWYHVEVHVYDRQTGKVVTDANPVITIHDRTAGKTTTVPIVTMQGIVAGAPDLHYGNNVQLAPGDAYTLTTKVNADVGSFRFHL